MATVIESEDGGQIFCGAPFTQTLFDGSFGQYVTTLLDKKDSSEIAHINAATGETMTNGEFLELSWKVGWALKSLNAGNGDVVVVSGENSFRNAAAATGCLLINAAFAPIDPKLKSFELSNIFNGYQPRYLFCNEAQAEDIYKALHGLDLKIPIILFDRDKTEDNRFVGFSYVLSQESVRIEPTPVKDPFTEIAVVMPSSGSTGLPKGVCLSHGALNFMTTKMSSYDWGKAGVFLQNSHLFWISGLYSLLGSYMGQVRVFTSKLEPDAILDAVKKYKPLMTFLSPSELTTLLKRPNLDPDALASIQILAVGGGPLNQFILDQLQEKLTKVPMLVQGYGMTENAGGVSQFVPGSDVLSVGRVDSGVQVKIVDPGTGRTLRRGEVGEIRVKCKYQMTCYLGKPEESKAAFDEDGWYKSGDLGYFSPEDLLYITGRIKNLIKYRNMQISPEEIEKLIIEMDGVADVGVDGIPNKEDQYHAVALVKKTSNSTITEQDVQAYVEENMSDHNKLRGGVFFVDEIPRTAHKKTKRDLLNALVHKLYNERVGLLKQE